MYLAHMITLTSWFKVSQCAFHSIHMPSMMSYVWACVCCLFVFVSLSLLFLTLFYLFSFTVHLFSVLHTIFNIVTGMGWNHCTHAQWGVLSRGGIQSSHTCSSVWFDALWMRAWKKSTTRAHPFHKVWVLSQSLTQESKVARRESKTWWLIWWRCCTACTWCEQATCVSVGHSYNTQVQEVISEHGYLYRSAFWSRGCVTIDDKRTVGSASMGRGSQAAQVSLLWISLKARLIVSLCHELVVS